MRFEQTCITTAIIINELADLKVHLYRQLAEAAEVSERTVARYIKALRAGGYPIKSVFYGEKRGVCIDPQYIRRGKIMISGYEYGVSDEECDVPNED